MNKNEIKRPWHEEPGHRYGENAARMGEERDPDRCWMEVQSPDGWRFYQCRYRNGKGYRGFYCGIHAKRYPETL